MHALDSHDQITPVQINAPLRMALIGRALRDSDTGLLLQSASLETLYSENFPPAFGKPPQIGADDNAIFSTLDAVRLIALKTKVLLTGETAETLIEIPAEPEPYAFRMMLERVDIGTGQAVLSIISNISESRSRERVLKTLLRELSHRSKNLLAIIQGIATQTARQARSLDVFLIKFRGRIQSLSNSQDLVTDSSWRGAFFFDLARRQFLPYWPDAKIPVQLDGVNAHLSPNAALHVGLALHELIVNSASHGAIAQGNANLTLSCRETSFNDQRAIEIRWSEEVAPLPSPSEADDNNFAKIVLERVVPVAVNGSATYTCGAAGTQYQLILPAREFEII